MLLQLESTFPQLRVTIKGSVDTWPLYLQGGME